MGVTDGGECNKGSAVMSGGGGAFLSSGGVSERDCWERLVRGILPTSKSSRYTTLVFFQSRYSQSNLHNRDSQIKQDFL